MDAAELLTLVRAELAPVARSLAEHRYLVEVESGRMPVESLRIFAGEQRAIIASDRTSFEHLLRRFPEPLAAGFFRRLAAGEAEALRLLERFAASVGLGLEYEPLAGCQAYSGYVAWLALNGTPADVALAFLANLETWGRSCARMRDALRPEYGDDAVAFFDFFARAPQGVEEHALELVATGELSSARKLRAAADPIWAAQHEHPFVRGIGEGNLEPRKFRHYIRQDYLFLIDYARLLALACARAPRLEEMGPFAQLAEAVLGREMELHRSYAADWDISAAKLEAEQPTATTRAYTDFLLRTATLDDYAELAAALLPCMWGYQELAARLAERGRPGNELYARWIDEYSGAEFTELTTWCKELTNGAARTGDHDRMSDAFQTSSRYELAFWDASWREEAPLLPVAT